MKKLVLSFIVFMAVIVAYVPVIADTVIREAYDISSTDKTTDATIYTGTAVVKRIIVTTDGSNNCTIQIRNGTSSGDILVTGLVCLAASYTCVTDMNILARTGIYANVTTSGDCTFNIHYREY